jgi:hypothetical protein
MDLAKIAFVVGNVKTLGDLWCSFKSELLSAVAAQVSPSNPLLVADEGNFLLFNIWGQNVYVRFTHDFEWGILTYGYEYQKSKNMIESHDYKKIFFDKLGNIYNEPKKDFSEHDITRPGEVHSFHLGIMLDCTEAAAKLMISQVL